MPEDLQPALAAVRPMLLDLDRLVRAVAAGRRRGQQPAHQRAELRPVDLKAGRHLQVVTTDGRTPTTRNLPAGAGAEEAVDALLAEPFGNWHVRTTDRVLQLRVTKKGMAQVHVEQVPVEQVPDEQLPVEQVPVEQVPVERVPVGPPGAGVPHDRVREHLLDPGDPIFTVLGADAAKRRQVDAFVRLLAAAVGPAAERARAAGRPLHVVDLGCGNAYLTVAAHRWLLQAQLDQVRTIGVELRPGQVARNAELADRLALPGLSFVAGSIATADPGLPEVDLVLALHACDTATDEALARAVRWQAPVVLAAPCCHHDLQRQLAAARAAGQRPPVPYGPLVRHGILRERFADVLTDALRAHLLRLLGYQVDVVEFIDSRHTPRNVMLRAARTGAAPTAAQLAEYRALTQAWQVHPALAQLLADELAPVLNGSPLS